MFFTRKDYKVEDIQDTVTCIDLGLTPALPPSVNVGKPPHPTPISGFLAVKERSAHPTLQSCDKVKVST